MGKNEMDPREREFQLILEKEVDQQLQMERLVQDCAIAVGDTIIFLFDQIPACVLQ